MKSTELKNRAQELAGKTNSGTISPTEVGGIMYDTVEYIEDVERNGAALGIRKTYTTVSAMEADSNPTDNEGNPLKKGMLVNIYNQEDPSSSDNGKVFSWQNPGWQLRSKIDAGYATREELTELGQYKDISGFIRIYTDADDKILLAIKSDGDVLFGYGVPSQIKEAIEDIIESVTELDDKIDAIDVKIKSIENKIDEILQELPEEYDLNYIHAIADSEGKILEDITSNGVREFRCGIKVYDSYELNEHSYNTIEDSADAISIVVDAENKVLEATYKNGKKYFKEVCSDNFSEKEILNDYNKREYAQKFVALSATRSSSLSVLHFSDIHADFVNLQRIIKFKEYFKDYLDIAINTGDTVNQYASDGFTFYSQSDTADIWNVIGNHDTRTSASWIGFGKVNTYNTYIKPFISKWGVVQPDGADEGKSYYYKDFDGKNIRIIVVDVMNYDDTQNLWFVNLLTDAKTKNLPVIVAAHYPPGGVNGLDCNWSSIDYKNIPSESLVDYYNPSFKIAAAEVQDFISSGGKFVCWLGGHTHTDIVGLLDGYDNQLVILADTAQKGTLLESPHIVDTKSQDSFNILTFDTNKGYIKMFKVGCEFDNKLRHRESLCIDYINKIIK